MPSDIFIKTASGWTAGLAKSIFIKTASATWSAAKSVWLFFDAGWTKVWPLSGVYPTRNPFISTTSSSTELSNATVLRVGTTYRGNRGTWNPNGYTISSYQYKWVGYSYQDPGDLTTNYDPSMTTLSGTTNDFTITGANYDRSWITFFVTAKASGGTAYDGSAESFRYYVVRQKPRIAPGGTPSFNITSPKVGDTISYSSSWDTTDAYRPEASRSTIVWYKNSSSSTTGGTSVQVGGYSYIVKETDTDNYIYAKETTFNSGSDYELGDTVGVSETVITSAPVGAAPNAFTYSLTNVGTVTTPSAPVQQRVSSTSNVVLVEMSSAFPSDTESYELWTYGSGSAAGGTLANPAVQSITTLNQYFSNGDIAYNGTFDTVTNISSSASNSPITTISRAIGSSRTLQFNVSETTGAQSWRISYTISGASGGNGTYTLNTNSMPRQTIIGGVSNPTVTINSITAYSGLDQTGSTTAGTAGFPTSLSSITKPSAFSNSSTSNYTFYTNLQVTGSQRRVTLPSAFTSGTTVYVSTNGYINWGGDDPGSSVSIPSLSTSGITVAPLAGDLRQGAVSASGTTSTGGLWYFADATNYWVTWWGNYYQDASQVARYQVKFYWGQSYADVYIINNSLTTLTPSTTAVQNGANQYQNFSSTTSQTSTLLSTASMNRVSTQDGVDDGRTAIVASPPVLTWTITWDAAGGEGGTQFTTQNRGSSHTAPSPGGRDGFDFVYYRYPASGGTDPVFVSSGGSYTPTASVTFGAIWTAKTYTVSYNANGGTGSPSSQTKTHGVALTLSSTTPTRATVGSTSYTFNGWNTSSDGTGTNYSAGGSYTANAAVTLYAKWTATTVSTKLATPTGLSATTTRTDGINISWNAVSGAAYYGVWYRGGAPVYDSAPDFGGPSGLGGWNGSGTSFLDTSIGSGVTRSYDVQAFKTGNPAGTKSDWAGPVTGTRASAPATPAPVLSTITGDNSSPIGGTFSWSFTNSPTAYSVFCTGPTGTVFTTSNAYTYTGTTFRPGYDGTGWQGSGDYTIYVSARNAGGDSAVAQFTRFMS